MDDPLTRFGREATLADHVFISYSHHDGQYVARMIKQLTAAGVRTWYDQHIDFGVAWEEVVKAKIDSAAVFAIVMTPAAEQSDWVGNELHRARSRKKLILAILLEGEPFFSLARLQYVDVRCGSLLPTHAMRRLRSAVAPPGAPETKSLTVPDR